MTSLDGSLKGRKLEAAEEETPAMPAAAKTAKAKAAATKTASVRSASGKAAIANPAAGKSATKKPATAKLTTAGPQSPGFAGLSLGGPEPELAATPATTSAPAPAQRTGTRTLRRFTGPRAEQPERCELCAVPLPPGGHRHLVDPEKRALSCACTPCAMLFDQSGAGGGRFRTVPDRYLADPGHSLDDGAWDLLQIPVSVAFFFRNAALDRLVALYPSPAGATESELDSTAWQAVLGRTRLAGLLEPDVEALLMRRHEGRYECFLVPIDICYELVGRMRLHWEGFDGGARARAELTEFFTHVARRAKPAPEARQS